MEEEVQDAELRLALVCYGGVSLAVYMHGVTKELQSLIRAARAFDDKTPGRLTDAHAIGTEPAYYAALQDLAAKGRQLSVSIDIIGGTSAGGINGIALSKGLATGAGQEPLKDVWINKGDIRALLRAPTMWLPAQAIAAAGAQLFRLFGARTPLKGEVMSKLIYHALDTMDTNPQEAALIPPGGTLELYVPTTDLGGFDVLVPSGAGGASNHDRQNAQVFAFCSDKDQFAPSYTADLAFAARASASFPGAFAPISQESFRTDTGKGRKLTFHPDVFHHRYPALTDENEREKVVFVDGGVLDNAPFDVVISAIGRRRADSEVYRRLVYIEPDPGRDLYAYAQDAPTARRRWLSDLLAVSKVKGNHPFLRDLLELRDMNERIDEVSAITERQKAYVVEAIAIAWKSKDGQPWLVPDGPAISYGTAGATAVLTTIPETDIQAVSDRMHIWVKDALYPSFSTYQRLKFDAAIRPMANELADRFGFSKTSAQAHFIEAATSEWVRQQTFWLSEPDKTVGAKPGDELGATLRPIDVPYRERRLMFILAGISELYHPAGADGKGRTGPPRADLDRLKAKAWNLLEDLRKAPKDVVATLSEKSPNMLSFLNLTTLAPTDPNRRDDPMLSDPSVFAHAHQDDFEALFTKYSETLCERIGDGGVDLWTAFKDNTRTWTNNDDKQALLSRYLGFPLWDGMIFPTLSLTRVPQLTPIGVHQFSPLMARELTPPLDEKTGKAEKLKGIPVSHFAGFFSAKSRENDYLWGRLDAAELILRLLNDIDASGAASRPHHLADAFQHVLDSETAGKEPLTRIGKLMDQLRVQVTNLAADEESAKPRAEQQDSVASAVPNQGSESLSV
jgi:patatin-related protein